MSNGLRQPRKTDYFSKLPIWGALGHSAINAS